MLGLFTSLFGRSQTETPKLVLTEENHNQYYKTGTELIEPYLILSDKSPRSDKNKEAKLLERIRYLDAVTQINQNNFAAFWLKGKAYQVLNQHENSYSQFEKSFELNKENPDVARELVLECMDLGKGQQAVEVSLYALQLNDKDAGLIGNLALAYLLNGDLNLASSTIDKAISADPADKINHTLKRIIDEVISGKREAPRKYSDL